MPDINLEEILSKNAAKIYFVGIGGIAMSAAANIAKNLGYEVLGSDSKEIYSPAKDVLDEFKINYFSGYAGKNIAESKADLFVISAGENQNNPEVEYIIKNNLPRVGLAEFLYELAKDRLRIVVTGTHGKSTTAALLGHLVKNLDNSSFMVGAVMQNYHKNFHNGDGHYFVFEGDEYKEQFDDPTPKFHFYKPDILVLTNLEYDHPDQFASLADLENEFEELINNMPPDGLIVYNADNAVLTKLVHKSNIASVSFGLENDADFKAEDVSYAGDFTSFGVKNKHTGDQLAKLMDKNEEYKIQLPGKMNVYNSLAAIAVLRTLGFSRENLVLDLISFLGLKRRFELVAVKNNITVIDDYAHHPTAVEQTLDAAKLRYPNSKLWAVFEPHTFSRTKALLTELSKAFASANEVLLADIYPARESAKDAQISSAEVLQAIASTLPPLPLGEGRGEGSKVRPVHNKQDALNILKAEAKPGDVIIVMAVGNFNQLAYELKEVL